MTRFGVSTWLWTSPLDDQTLDALAPRIAGWGFRPRRAAHRGPRRLGSGRTGERLAALGLGATTCAVMTPGRDLTTTDASLTTATQGYLRACVDIAAAVGSRVVAGPIYAPVGRLWRQDEAERSTTILRLVEALRPVADHAGARGVRLALEPLNRYETSLINTVDQALEVVRAVDSPALGICLDTFHQNVEERRSGGRDPASRGVGSRTCRHVAPIEALPARTASTGQGSPRRSHRRDTPAPCASSRSPSRTLPSPGRRPSGDDWRHPRMLLRPMDWHSCTPCSRGRCQRTRPGRMPRLVLVAGRPSHPAGAHEFRAGVRLLARSLASVPHLVVDVHEGGEIPALSAEDASAVVMYSDGGPSHPLLEGDRLATLDTLARAGMGIGLMHYAVEMPLAQGGAELDRWIGGHYQDGVSCNPIWSADVQPVTGHPVTNGVAPFTFVDEWYFGITFPGDAPVRPILTATPPDDVRAGPYVWPAGPYPHILAARGRTETLMWVVERPDGGRGFGLTGGHFHANWAQRLVPACGAQCPCLGQRRGGAPGGCGVERDGRRTGGSRCAGLDGPSSALSGVRLYVQSHRDRHPSHHPWRSSARRPARRLCRPGVRGRAGQDHRRVSRSSRRGLDL